jgi:WD40 repeat protein
VQTVIVIAPNGRWLLAINSAEGQENTISASRAELVGLAGSSPPTPPDLADAFGHVADTIQVSPDSKVLTYFGGIDKLKRWTIGAGKPAQATTATERCYGQRAVSRDGLTAVCQGFVQEPMAVWDLAENRKIGEVPLAADESVYTMVLSEDGSVLAKPAPGGLRVVPVRSTARIKGRTVPLKDSIATIAFSTSGRFLAVGLTTGRLLVFRLADNNVERVVSFDLGDTSVTALAFSPDDQLVAAGMKSGNIEVWEISQRFGPFAQLTGSRAFAGLAVSDDESRVAIASAGGDVVRVDTRDLATGAPVGKPVEFTMPILGLGFVNNRLGVIGKGPEGKRERCPVGTLSTMVVVMVDSVKGPPTEIVAPPTRCDLTGARFAPKGIITAAENGIALWREDTGAWLEIWNQTQRLFTNPELTASADGTRVAFMPHLPWDTNPPLKVEAWSLLDGTPRLLASLDQTTPRLSLFLSGDGSVLAVRTDMRIDLWRIGAGGSATALGTVDIGNDNGPAALDKTGNRIAVARQNGAIEIWETRGPRLVGTIPPAAEAAPVAVLNFSGNFLIVVDEGGATRRLDTRVDAWMQHACALTAPLLISDKAEALLGSDLPENLCVAAKRAQGE